MTAEPTIQDYMTKTPQTVGEDQSLTTAHQIMRRHRIRHLPVLAHGRLVGIVSQRDLHFIETLRGVDPDEVQVSEAMTAEPYTVRPTAPLRQVARTLARRKLGAALVVERKKCVGVFTTIDALNALAGLLDAGPHRR